MNSTLSWRELLCLGFRRKTFQPRLHLQPCTNISQWIFAVKPRSCVQIRSSVMEHTFWFRCSRQVLEFEYLNTTGLQTCRSSCGQGVDIFLSVLVNAVCLDRSCSAAHSQVCHSRRMKNMKYGFSNVFLCVLLINPSLLLISCFALEKAKKNLLKASPLISKWELEKMVNCAIASLSWRN